MTGGPGLHGWWLTACTAAALAGFAGNSLLTRAGVGSGAIDAASFTTIRLAAGALVLALLWRLRTSSQPAAERTPFPALALTAYIMAFSFAYERLGASVGALLLFGAVQITMMGWALARGERPRWYDWAGLAVAACGLMALMAPGLSAPDPFGAALMMAAGAAWGVYSLIGRGVREPLEATARAFRYALPAGVLGSLVTLARAHVTLEGAMLAAVSGGLSSGVAYTLWYAALPSLSPWRAGLLQLLVPALTAIGAVLWLGESLTLRIVVAGGSILAGVALPTAWRAVDDQRITRAR